MTKENKKQLYPIKYKQIDLLTFNLEEITLAADKTAFVVTGGR